MNAGDLLLGTLAGGALLLPGWLAARLARVPFPLLAGFGGSAVGLVLWILVLGALDLPLSPAALGLPWLGLTAGLGLRWQKSRPQPHAANSTGGSVWREDWPLLLPLAPILAVVAYRAGAQPLFGVDTIFRWNFLAEQMLAHRSLAFYPPVTAADYALYSWPDGIAPLVSSLYFWLYTAAGSARPGLTAPLVVLQFLLLAGAVYSLGRRDFSPRAGAGGVALLACSPLVAWACAMGQETGLTALAFVGLLLYLPRTRAEETPGLLVAAGVAAALGALAREYGLVLPIFGLALAAARRLSPRAIALFAAVAAIAILPWYLRNAVRTGNPLFDLSIGGVFPTNAIHQLLQGCYQRAFGWAHVPPAAAPLLAINSLAGSAGLLAGAVFLFRRSAASLAAAGLVLLLWAASVSYTAAGFTYSLRVLSPALALGACLGGAVLARAVPGRRYRTGVAVALTLFATDAALRTLVLPANVHRLPVDRWLATGRALHDYHERPIYREFVRIAGRDRLLVLGPNALLTRLGAHTVPLWSPEVRFLFDPALSPAEIGRRLRAARIGFALLNTGAVNECFLAHSPFFRDPAGALTTAWSDGDMVLLRVNDPAAP